MEVAARDPVPDRALPKPELDELSMRSHAALSRSERPQLSTYR